MRIVAQTTLRVLTYAHIAVILWLDACSIVTAKDCEMNDQCSCTFDDGSILDLTSLGNQDQTPRFQDVKCDKTGNFYSYNPCYPFAEKSCTDAAVCIINSDRSESILIGDAAKAGFQYNLEIGHVVAAYTSGTIANLRLSEVILICNPSACTPSIVADGQQDTGEFQLTLTTVCACPNGCNKAGPINCSSSGGLSVGSILCITFFSIIILYAIVGAVLMKFVKKKDGIDILPNITFWKSVPVLIKGGVMFTVRIVRRDKTPSTYQSI